MILSIRRLMLAGLALIPSVLRADPIVIGIAGDSTVADYAPDSKQMGWGQSLPADFDGTVTVANLSKNGRSTKTFLHEGLWAATLARHPNYVLIQFGHNDSHSPDHPEHTDPQGEYKTLIARFVDEARAQGAIPILVTPVQRRTEVDGLLPYADAMREIARQQKVPLVDLHRLSGELYVHLGPEKTESLAMPGDKTHFSRAGAAMMADLVALELGKLLPDLKDRLKPIPAGFSVFPLPEAKDVCPDTPLTLRFKGMVGLGNSGVIRIIDRASGTVVEAIDLAQGPLTQSIGGLPGYRYYPVTVAGDTVTIHPKNGVLAYGHAYSVEIPQSAISGLASEATWAFATRASPPPADQARLVVATDGTGDFATIQGAIDSLPEGNVQPRTIFVRPGVYEEMVAIFNRNFVSLVGENRKTTVLEYATNQNFNGSGGNPYAKGTNPSAVVSKKGNIYHRGVLLAHRVSDFTLSNLTVRNTTPHGGSQAEAIIFNGNLDAHAVVRDVTLFSYQDTLQINGQAFIANTTVTGDVDYLWGTGPSFFTGCTFHSVSSGEYYTQIRNPASNHGFVFDHCVFDGAAGITGNYLARIEPNRFPASEVVLLHCILGPSVNPVGWFLQEPKTAHFPTDQLRFWEAGSVDDAGKPIDASARLPASKRLDPTTDALVIAQYSDPKFVLGGWSPATTQ